MRDGPALLDGLSTGSDIRTSLQKIRMYERLYTVKGSEFGPPNPRTI